MTAENWRELLDDPEVRDVVTKAINGPGRKRYDPRGKDALVFDELEPYLWDRAVEIAQNFPDEAAPIGDPDRRYFYAFLWRGLLTAIPWLWKEFAGDADSAQRGAWNAGIRSVEAITEANDNGDAPALEGMVSHADAMWHHRITAADPLGVILRRERLEAMLRQAEHRARGGAYVTETSPDVLCREPICRNLVVRAGYCNAHYKRQFAQWGRADGSTPPCAAVGCNLLAVTRGYCERHYQAEHKRRQRESDPWPEAEAGPCAVESCERQAETKGWCALHYAQARESSAPPCTEPGCDRPAFAKGLCRRDYKRARRASGPPCAGGCGKVAEVRGLCNTCYERQRQARA